MRKKVAIGIQSFEELMKKNFFYVDKTSFIKEWWENGDSVTLVTRPRRFGKTMNMNMLECFFSVEYGNRGDLFEGLSIWEEEEYRSLQGTYPVISLSFAGIKESNYESAKKRIWREIKNLYSRYMFLAESDKIIESDRDFLKKMVKEEVPDDVDVSVSLQQLSKILQQQYGKKVIILLDEYDTPMLEAYEKGYWDELASFTRSLFNSTFKTNPYMNRGIMTGITRVSKESIFSDLNNLEVVTTTSDKYATAFGFTEEEVFSALDEHDLSDQRGKVKEWYDGFVFGGYPDIYNPWSVLNFLEKRKYGAYWANTSSGGLVSSLIRKAGSEIKTTFEELMHGNTIKCPIDEQLVYNQLEGNETAIWSLLVASGYLKVVGVEERTEYMYEDEPIYELAITNGEVRIMFRTMIKDWFNRVKQPYNNFIKAMLQNDLEAMNVYMNHISLQTFSYFDTGKGVMGPEPERFYHGFVLGLIAELSGEYVITSNRESGFGRYDVMLEPKDKGKKAVIMEFKVYNPRKETVLEEAVQSALTQIEEKQYETVLLNKGFKKEQIYKYGFAFKGKEVLIG